MYCPKCDRELSDGVLYCPTCGEKAQEHSCAECGATLKTGAIFCSRCGSPVQRKQNDPIAKIDEQPEAPPISAMPSKSARGDAPHHGDKPKRAPRKLPKKLNIILGAAAVFIVACIVTIFSAVNYPKYQECIAQYNDGDYAAAADGFSALSGLLNSDDWCKQAMYKDALDLYKQNRFEHAKTIFHKLDGFKNSNEWYTEACYQRGIELYEARLYDEANSVFKELGGYKNAAGRYALTIKTLIDEQIASGKFAQAFDTLPDIADENERARLKLRIQGECYDIGLECERVGDWEGAIDIFTLLDTYRDSSERLQQAVKSSYENDLSYDDIERFPDDLKGGKVSFIGKVVQIIDVENSTEQHIRLNINNNYNETVYCYYDTSILSYRILEDDVITIYGISDGLYTYESIEGVNITIPLIKVNIIVQ